MARPLNACPITIPHDAHVWDEPPFATDDGQQCAGIPTVFCPFTPPSYDCTGGCPNNNDRACINGED